ncbi:MAG: DUF6447 family protein [Chlorobiales bacterium]|nr:DUF6447 family protein [Chlorobiales bacterium]
MAKTKIEEPTLTHNGTTYKVTELSEEAQKQLINVKVAEGEIRRLQMQLAIAQTAHSAYEQALVAALPL